MLDALLVAVAVVTAVWIGWIAREEKMSTAKLLGLAVGFFAGALVLYGWQCEAASIPDILLFRDVSGPFFCTGRLTFLGYVFLLAVPVSVVRKYLDKYMT
jgi:hypothetical protein